jgi:hypothetical protein
MNLVYKSFVLLSVCLCVSSWLKINHKGLKVLTKDHEEKEIFINLFSNLFYLMESLSLFSKPIPDEKILSSVFRLFPFLD